MPSPTPFSLDDCKDPQRLFYILRQFASQISAPTAQQQQQQLQQQQSTGVSQADFNQIYANVQRALSVNGSNPLNVSGLPGKLAESQQAVLYVFTADPTTTSTLSASQYDVGAISTYNGAFYYVKDGAPHTWQSVTLAAPSNMVTTNTAQPISATKTFSIYQIIDTPTQSFIVYRVSGATDSYIGMASSADDIIVGSILGSLALRTTAGKSILLSSDGGATAAFRVVSNKVGVNMVPVNTLDVAGTFGTTGIATFPAGTAAAPTVALVGALTSGLYSPAANELGLAANGAAAIKISSAQLITVNKRIASYNSDTVVGNGVAGIVARDSRAGNTASIAAFTVYTPAASGEYHFSWYMVPTTGGTGTVQITITWTDDYGVQTYSSIALPLTVGTYVQVIRMIRSTATAIDFQVIYTATGTYYLAYALQRLS